MTLARFTPSVLDGETLEQLFVHRHHLLDDVMIAVRESADGEGRRHRLFVGPRGAGKTHLISLINHRVQHARDEGLHVGLSWLIEDPWEIETYDDLLAQILEHAGDEDVAVGEQGLLELVAERGPLVVLVENLDQVLEQIGADGQRRLRALLENERPLLLVATTTRLSRNLASQSEPFYGFFDVTQLEPFSVDEAADMLRHVAEYSHDHSLGALLDSPHANARLATIAHLAGGQPRVWALLGTGLTDTGIDDMVEMLIARFDDLTPYYQEQLARLSPSERKAVRRLADADRPLTVRDLAELAKTDQRSMSKTVSDLRKRGWVRRHESILTAHLDSRLSYYELAEPLARIAFQMKAARGEPVQTIVEFLSLWFEQTELAATREPSSATAPYLRAAKEGAGQLQVLVTALTTRTKVMADQTRQPTILFQIEDALAALDLREDASKVMALPGPVGQLIVERLEKHSIVELRLQVMEFAIRHRIEGYWRKELDDLAARLKGEFRARALAALIAISTARDAREALLDELAVQLAELSLEQALELFAWLAMALGASADSADMLLKFSNRPVLAKREFGIARSFLVTAAATGQVLIGNPTEAERLARSLYAHAKNELPEVVRESVSIFALGSILIEVGKARETVALIDSIQSQDKFLETQLSELRAQAILRVVPESLSHADGVPDGLGLSEGTQPGESGVVGP